MLPRIDPLRLCLQPGVFPSRRPIMQKGRSAVRLGKGWWKKEDGMNFVGAHFLKFGQIDCPKDLGSSQWFRVSLNQPIIPRGVVGRVLQKIISQWLEDTQWSDSGGRYTLQGTNISPKNGILKMIFLFPRWDMLIPWRYNWNFCLPAFFAEPKKTMKLMRSTLHKTPTGCGFSSSAAGWHPNHFWVWEIRTEKPSFKPL